MSQEAERGNLQAKMESVNEREERTLKFWQDNKIFEKSLEKKSSRGEFVFYDGPPFATGLPHFGHLLPTTIKDIIPRYKTMKGYHVERKWGWDCHGLPIENLIEGELGLKTKKNIEELGVAKFNAAAQASVLRYESDWKKIIPRIGRWVDMEDDYKTMDSNYTESIWWIFKDLYDKDLIYEGYKSMHLCPRCETTLANFEVNQGYKDITDLSLTAKFELVDEPGTFVLAWTTTPWTLPGNVALAVNPEITYARLKINGLNGIYILAKDRLVSIKDSYEVIGELKATELVSKKYKPIFDYYSNDKNLKNRENGWKIYGADFVTTEDGTGVVHIAPAFGEDDMALGTKEKLPFVQHVGTNGLFKAEVEDFAELPVKPKDNKETGADHQSSDIEIIKNLSKRGLLFAKEKIVHSYPHCWRCDTPLLNYAASSWFVKVTEFKNRLLANNQKTNWVPENLRDGRFGRWLEGARDWAISRSRYWGAPLPVWRCGACKKIKVLGSLDDLKKENLSKNKYFLMRHGEANSNLSGIVTSDPDDSDLTPKGENDVKDSAKKLKDEKIDLIISSPFSRTKETAAIVAKELGVDPTGIIFDDRLREVGMGEYNHETIERYHSHFRSQEERFYVRPKGGENLNDVKARVMDLIYELENKNEGKKILLISHGDPIWLAQVGSLGLTPNGLTKLELSGGEGEGGPVEVKFHKKYKDLSYLKNGQFKELFFPPLPHNENYELDFHKPYIDDMKFVCSCGSEYIRIPEVFDCWFESGSMPYASVHYPFENKEKFEANFPADFIAEGLDQTRGWFYSLMVLSTALFDEPTFKQVVVNGLILAEDGQKMSKRLKNYPDLMYVVEKYGADALRFYIINSPAVRADDMRFAEKGVDEVYKKLILRLLNVLSFYELYSVGSKSNAEIHYNILDLWITESLHKLAEEVEHNLKNYELDKAARPILDFVDNFSTWYIRRSRDRFKSEDTQDRNAAIGTTRYVLTELAKIIAPFTPFVAEEIYQKVKGFSGKESVHLEDWPFYGVVHEDELNEKKRILDDMIVVRQIVSLVLDERKKAEISVRQPLQKLSVKDDKLKSSKYFESLASLIKDEVNVKEIIFDNKLEVEVYLDKELTRELREAGDLRELVRFIQDARKNLGLIPSQKIKLNFSVVQSAARSFLEKYGNEIKRSVNAGEIIYSKAEALGSNKVEIGGTVFSLAIEV